MPKEHSRQWKTELRRVLKSGRILKGTVHISAYAKNNALIDEYFHFEDDREYLVIVQSRKRKK